MRCNEIREDASPGRALCTGAFLGILLAFFSNYLVSGLELANIEWRWMFGVEAFPAIAFFLLLAQPALAQRVWIVGALFVLGGIGFTATRVMLPLSA